VSSSGSNATVSIRRDRLEGLYTAPEFAGQYVHLAGQQRITSRDLINMINVLNNAPNSNYTAAVRQVVNVEDWMLYFAVNALLENEETALGNGVGDDYGMYRGLSDPRFVLVCHDWDTVLGEGDTGGNLSSPIFRATALPAINRFMKWPVFAPIYYATLKRLTGLGIQTTIVSKNIGYELRCADPIPYDMEYTRDLGYCAAKYLFSGGHAAMVSLRGGHFVPIPFARMLDPQTGRTRVRMVDIHSTRYAIARRYMIRLRRDDFEDPATVARFAGVAHLTPEDFRRQFAYLVEHEAPPLDLLHRGDASPTQAGGQG